MSRIPLHASDGNGTMRASLRIVCAFRSWAHFSYYESTLRELCNMRHKVIALFDPKWCDGYAPDTPVRHFENTTGGFTSGYLLPRKDFWRLPVFACREVRNYSRYLRFQDQSAFYLKRLEAHFPKLMQIMLRSRQMQRVLATDTAQRMFVEFENAVPPYEEVVRWLSENRPDVIVASPVNLWWSEEVEYIKAGKALGIPTVASVLSWDNLTTKGVLHVIPDALLVWNAIQQEDAAKLGIPQQKTIITGAPPFDKWKIAGNEVSDSSAFYKKVGLDPRSRFVVYLGSSANIATDESWIVDQLAESLRNAEDEHIRSMTVLVRPHPGNANSYDRLSASKSNIVIWPKGGSIPDTGASLKDFTDTLHYSVCTLGVNTSGMIDAVIFGKPCIAIIMDQYRLTQSNTVHFQYLLGSDVLEIARDIKEAVTLIADIVRGKDSKCRQRIQFVERIIRPRGVHVPAGIIAARAIQMMGLGKSVEEINLALGPTHSRDDISLWQPEKSGLSLPIE